MAATVEFRRRQVRLPIHLHTVTRVDRRTVYAHFLPPAPVDVPADPLAELETEMRALMRRDRMAALNLPEMLRELEILIEAKPQLSDVLELLQLLLIGG
jgi:hypothetical protein